MTLKTYRIIRQTHQPAFKQNRNPIIVLTERKTRERMDAKNERMPASKRV